MDYDETLTALEEFIGTEVRVMVYSLEMTPLKLIVELSGILAADQFREARRQFGEAWGWPADETWHRFLVHGGPETPDRATAFFLHRHSFTRGWWGETDIAGVRVHRSAPLIIDVGGCQITVWSTEYPPPAA